MIVLAPAHLKTIADACEAAWPEEACGLLVGRKGPGQVWRVERVEPSRNLAADPKRHFEVDPGLRIGLERELRHAVSAVIGLYHSHPDGPARPSREDEARIYEPELAWLIASVLEGQMAQLSAFAPKGGGGFAELRLRGVDWPV